MTAPFFNVALILFLILMILNNLCLWKIFFTSSNLLSWLAWPFSYQSSALAQCRMISGCINLVRIRAVTSWSREEEKKRPHCRIFKRNYQLNESLKFSLTFATKDFINIFKWFGNQVEYPVKSFKKKFLMLNTGGFFVYYYGEYCQPKWLPFP